MNFYFNYFSFIGREQVNCHLSSVILAKMNQNHYLLHHKSKSAIYERPFTATVGVAPASRIAPRLWHIHFLTRVFFVRFLLTPRRWRREKNRNFFGALREIL